MTEAELIKFAEIIQGLGVDINYNQTIFSGVIALWDGVRLPVSSSVVGFINE